MLFEEERPISQAFIVRAPSSPSIIGFPIGDKGFWVKSYTVSVCRYEWWLFRTQFWIIGSFSDWKGTFWWWNSCCLVQFSFARLYIRNWSIRNVTLRKYSNSKRRVAKWRMRRSFMVYQQKTFLDWNTRILLKIII